MEFRDLNKDMIVFSYRISPDFGKEGDNGGFLLELRGNGNLRFARYKLFDEISLLKIFKLNREETKEIFDLLDRTEKIWSDIPEELDNHLECIPGYSNEFVFLNWKRIEAHNIKKTWMPGMIIKERKYYKENKENMRYENQVIEIFEEISRILKKKHIDLGLRQCVIDDTCRVKVRWIDKTKR